MGKLDRMRSIGTRDGNWRTAVVGKQNFNIENYDYVTNRGVIVFVLHPTHSEG